MTDRERFRRIMNFQEVDRIPVIEFASFWEETLARWLTEGLNPEHLDDISLRKDFGLDDYRQFWMEPYSKKCPLPPGHGLPIINGLQDYRQIRKNLYPSMPWVQSAVAEAASAQDEGSAVIWFTLEGFFWFPRYLMGIEKHLYGFYDQPDLIHNINDELADYHCRIIREFGRVCSPDFMSFAEDLSYNNGPMIGRNLFDEFLLPYYKRVIPELRNLGCLSFLDSDGLLEDIIPWYIDAGFDGCLPCERNAGNHPAEIREHYPEWLMIGGVEKRTLYGPPENMLFELESMFSVARTGGYIPSVDHQTPPGVSLEAFRCYVDELHRHALIR